MKRTILITGITAIILITLGSFAKTMHWPGAAITLTTGIFILAFVFAPIALRNNWKQAEKKKTFFYVISYLTVALLFVSALFKILHWPGAAILLIIGTLMPFTVFVPALLLFAKKNSTFSVSNLITILLFLAYTGVTATFLALNISRDMIDEAVTVQKEMKELNMLIHDINKEFIEKHADSKLISNAESIKKEITDVTKAIVSFPENQNTQNLIDNPEKILNKDNYGIAGEAISHRNPSMSGFIRNIINYKKEFESTYHNNKTPFDTLSMKYSLQHNLSNSPKIWTIANLTSIKSQIEIQEHLYLKNKILNEPPK